MKVRIAFGWQTTRPDGSVARVVRFLEHRPVRKTYEGGDRGDLFDLAEAQRLAAMCGGQVVP